MEQKRNESFTVIVLKIKTKKYLKIGSLLFCFLIASCDAKIKNNKIIRVLFQNPVSSLDPLQSTTFENESLVSLLFETLYSYSISNEKQGAVFSPVLAEGMPEVDQIKNKIKIKIKNSVFNDDPCFKSIGKKGRPVISDDIVYSLKRGVLFIKQHGGEGMQPLALAERWIKGFSEWTDGVLKGTLKFDDPIDGLKTLDSNVIEITFKYWDSDYLFYLSHPTFSVVSREAVDFYGGQLSHRPVGSGPYKLTKIIEAFSKNISLKNKDLNDSTELQFFYSQENVLNQLTNGKLDLLIPGREDLKLLLTPTYELDSKWKALGYRLISIPEFDTTLILFNMNDPIIGQNISLRRAIRSGINSKLWVKAFYGGWAEQAKSLFPSELTDMQNKDSYGFNPTLASEEIIKAGYSAQKPVPQLRYLAQDATVFRQMGEFVARQLADIGIVINREYYPWNELVDKIRKGDGQLYDVSLKADYPAPMGFLSLFYRQKNAVGLPTISSFFNPAFNELFDQALKDNDKDKIETMNQMQKLLDDHVVGVYLAHRSRFLLYKDTSLLLPNDRSLDSIWLKHMTIK